MAFAFGFAFALASAAGRHNTKRARQDTRPLQQAGTPPICTMRGSAHAAAPADDRDSGRRELPRPLAFSSAVRWAARRGNTCPCLAARAQPMLWLC